jgi:hypothetical protein
VCPLGVSVPSILIEEDSGREARRVGFCPNPKLCKVEKVRCDLFYFFV